VEPSPSWEASQDQDIPRILWKPKVHYRIHKSPPSVPVLSQMDAFHVLLSHLCRNMVRFLRWGVVSTSFKPQTGGPPLVGCQRLLIQYIRSYPPYLEAVPPSSTWGRAMPWWQGHITVTGTNLSRWQGTTYHGAMPRWQGRTYHGAMPWWQISTNSFLSSLFQSACSSSKASCFDAGTDDSCLLGC
jgi:hypothetical protein